MSSIDVPLKPDGFGPAAQRGFGQTSRKDTWWLEPLLVLVGYLSFIAYANWAVYENNYYKLPGTSYLSPMYSPLLFVNAPSWWPGILPYSAAIFILWAPLGFRFTCYYYRGAYYKAFWADPPSCTVGEPRKSYWGERTFPLILQNVHRYFLYLAILFIGILSYDAWRSLWFDGPAGPGTQFGLGLGSLVLIANPILLALYTFGCHSFRHLIGGGKDVLSGNPVRKSCYGCVSSLNRRHMLWAWISMFYVGFADLYIRLCAKGVWTDWRIF
ncbi:MAG TPA: hypothetical protein VIY49_36985 [Bryobacteraceae bacterium]